MSGLREQLEGLAHRGQVRGASDVLAAARHSLPTPDGRSSQVARRTATVVVGLLVAAVVGSVLVATRDSRQSDAVTTDDGVERGDVSPLFLLPSQVPDGFAPEGSWGGDAPEHAGATLRDDGWTSIQRWARLGEAGTPIEVLDVSWRPNRGGEDPLAPYRPSAQPLVVRGRDALLSQDGARLVWEEPDIGVVMVTGTTAPSTPSGDDASPLPRELLQAVAEGLQVRSDGGLDLMDPPVGFEYLAEWPGLASEGRNPRSARYAGTGGRALQVHLVDHTEIPPAVNLGSSVARRTTVRGQLGVITSTLVGPLSSGSGDVEAFVGELNVQWLEPSGQRVTLSADGIGEPDLLMLAEGLERVDGDTWRSLNQPTTTTTAPPATSPSTTVPPPEGAPELVQVQGSYQGRERFQLFEGPCSFTSHVLESTFELDGGEAWQFRSDYCGTVEGDVWTGAGTFTFTTADGSTITGETSNSARLPSTGEPYDLDVTDGTGAFAGATGSCALDNHLRQDRFGEQEQYGTFSCDITRPRREAG